jgi:deoxyribodipyrimidine photo-lyase
VDGADRTDVVGWVSTHLGDLCREGPDGVATGGFVGGQTAADEALGRLDVAGYARRRSQVLPASARGASRMSPYIRYGLLPLPLVWAAVQQAPEGDRRRYRDELLWAEYARHLYARVGAANGRALRREQPTAGRATWPTQPWPPEMACMAAVVDELHTEGWVVNQTRMWLASQWAVRAGADWRHGEDEMFAHLLDGSRASNRLGWQWTVGTGSGRAYGFSRWQVEKRAPALCRRCPLAARCPIQEWPDAVLGPTVAGPDLGRGPVPAGPEVVEGAEADTVWLTLGQAAGVPRGDPRRARRRAPARGAARCGGPGAGRSLARGHVDAGARVGPVREAPAAGGGAPVAVAGPPQDELFALLQRLAPGPAALSAAQPPPDGAAVLRAGRSRSPSPRSACRSSSP